MDDITRTERLVRELRGRYPDSIPACGQLRDNPSAGVSWPDWCWLPMEGVHFYLTDPGRVAHGAGGDAFSDLARVTALTLWRLGRGIYRPEMAVVENAVAELHSSAGGGAEQWAKAVLPPLECWTAALQEWCVYLSMPELPEPVDGMPLGIFVHLEHDINTGRPELRLLIDTDGSWDGLIPAPVYLDRRTLGAAIGDSEANAYAVADRGAIGTDLRSLLGPGFAGQMQAMAVWQVLPLALCLLDADVHIRRHDDASAVPTYAAARNGLWRPATATHVWNLTYDKPRLHAV